MSPGLRASLRSGDPELAASIEALWRDPQARSRNRHFDRFRRNPRLQGARRVVRYLLALRATLQRLPAAAIQVQREAALVRVQYRDSGLGLSRVVFLTEHELGLLAEDPAVAERLGEGDTHPLCDLPG